MPLLLSTTAFVVGCYAAIKDNHKWRRCTGASWVSVVARILQNLFSNFACQFEDIELKHR